MCCPSNTRKHPEPPCPPQGLLLSFEQSCSSHHPWPWPKGKQALMTVLTMRRVWCWTGVVCGPNVFNRPLILGFLFVCLPCFWHGRKQCHTFGCSKGQNKTAARPSLGLISRRCWVSRRRWGFLFSSPLFILLSYYSFSWTLGSCYQYTWLFVWLVLFWPSHVGCEIQWPDQGANLHPLHWKQSLNYGTFRKVLSKHTFNEHLLWEMLR